MGVPLNTACLSPVRAVLALAAVLLLMPAPRASAEGSLYDRVKAARNEADAVRDAGSPLVARAAYVELAGEREGVDETELTWLRASIEATGARVVHFGYPLERVGYTQQHRSLLRLEAETAGLEHFDPSPEIEALTKRQELYFPTDKGHANAAGNDQIARFVLKFLEGSGLLPPKGE